MNLSTEEYFEHADKLDERKKAAVKLANAINTVESAIGDELMCGRKAHIAMYEEIKRTEFGLISSVMDNTNLGNDVKLELIKAIVS